MENLKTILIVVTIIFVVVTIFVKLQVNYKKSKKNEQG
jgi:hypothetical protein